MDEGKDIPNIHENNDSLEDEATSHYFTIIQNAYITSLERPNPDFVMRVMIQKLSNNNTEIETLLTKLYDSVKQISCSNNPQEQ